MIHLAARGLSVDLQILDNKASTAYKEAITFQWNTTFQVIPSDMHCRNWAEMRHLHIQGSLPGYPGWW
jgi:hypothetical protein